MSKDRGGPKVERPYKIDKGIPMPRPPRGHLYPWEHMEVGDSFVLPCEPEERERVGNRARNAGASYAQKRKLDWKFRIRAVEGGMRIWRVE